MRNIYLITFLFLIACNSVQIEVETDLESNNLIGAVKDLSLLKYQEDILIQNIEVTYSEKGFIEGRKEFQKDSLVISEITLRDDNNRVSEVITTFSDGTKNVRLYYYDNKGLSSIEQIVDGEEHTFWVYKNDDLGRKINETVRSENKTVSIVKYEYPTDSIIRTIVYDESGNKLNLMEVQVKNGGRTIETNFENQITKEITANGLVVIERDSLMNAILEEHYFNGLPTQTYKYWYDFDEYSNWIMQFKYLDGQIIETTERTITYY